MPDMPDDGGSSGTIDREAASALEQESYRAFIDMSPDASLAHLDGVVVYCNGAADKLFAVEPPNSLSGMKVDELVHPDELAALHKQRSKFLSMREWSQVKRRFVRLDGGEFYSEGAARTFELDGKTAYLVIFRDISERLEAEAALRDSELMYRTIMENAADSIFIHNNEGRFVEANESALRSLGYDRDELLSLSLTDVDPTVNHNQLSRYQMEMEKGEVIVVQGVHRRKDGTAFPVEARGRRIEVRGENCFLSVVRDTSEELAQLRAKDDRFEDFTRNTVDRFWETDSNHRLIFSSQPAPELFTEIDRRLGVDVVDAHFWDKEGVNPDDDEWQDIRARFGAHESPLEFAWTRRDSDQTIAHLRSWATPVFESDGEFKGYRGTTRDATGEFEARRQKEDLEFTFLTAMETIAEGFSLWDSEHRFVACNSHFVDARPDLVDILIPGIHFRDVMAHQAALGHFPESVGNADEWIDEVTERHWTVSEPYEISRDDKCYRVRNQRTMDGGVLSFQLDITEIKRREEALRESEQLFRAAFENSAVGLGLVDLDGYLTFANHSLCELLGYDIDELIGMSFADLSHPNDLARSQRIVTAMRDPMPASHTMEKRYLRRDGKAIWAIASVSPILTEVGRASGAVIQVQDISARRVAEQAVVESEAMTQAFLDATFDTATLLDPDGIILGLNEAAAQRWQKPQEALIGTSLFDHPSPIKIDVRKQRMKEVVESGVALREVIDKSGDKWTSANIAPIAGNDGEVSRIAVFTRDITEQKRAENSLIDSENTLRAFLDATTDAAWLIDPEGIIVMLNSAAADRIGIRPEIAVGTSVYSYSSEEDAKSQKAVTERVLKTKGLVHDSRFLHGRWMDGILQPIFDSQGEIAHIAIFGRDVTEIMTAEEAARESAETLRVFLDASLDAAMLVAADGTIVAMNETVAARIGVTAEEAVGTISYDYFPPEERNIRKDRVDQVIRTGVPLRHLAELTGRWIDAQLHPVFDAEGRATSVAIFSRDITEQRLAEIALAESEERFRGIFEKTAVGMELESRVGEFGNYNRAFADFVGYSLQTVERMRAADLIHPDEITQTLEDSRRLWDGEVDQIERDIRFVHREGHVVWARASRSLIRDGHGKPKEVVGIFQDVTDHKLAEESLRQAQKMEAVGQLTGGVAHDFNNILAAILGNLELIGHRAADDTEIRQRVERAINSAKTGGMLTNRLLAFSRRQTLEPKVIEVLPLIESMTDLLQTTLGPGISIETSVDDDTGYMMVDRNQLENALLNLAINARDAMGAVGSLHVRCQNEFVEVSKIVTGDELSSGPYVTISITDTGPGMAPAIIEHCFEPFFTTKDVGEGSGLGLSMVYGFVKQSGGHIDVVSTLGQGTTFKLYLPMASPEASADESQTDRLPIPMGQGERVFIVEDDDDVRDSTSSMLRLLGYEVIDGGDGPDAIARLKGAGDIDLFLTDIVLPNGLRGTDLVLEVGLGWPNVPVMYMTGYADEATSRHRDWPAVEPRLLQKPFNMRELANKVRICVDEETSD